MTLNEIITETRKLNKEEKLRLYKFLRDSLTTSRGLRVGDRVRFTLRNGVEVVGTLKKINPKTVKVSAHTNKAGFTTDMPVEWSVSKALVLPVEEATS